jgi:uncharacterized membrane protein
MAEEDRETGSRQETATGDEGQQERNGRGGGDAIGQSLTEELKQIIRDAALEVLGPAARQATSSAAKYAVKKGPELVRDNVMPAVDKAGGAGGLAQQVMSKGGETLSQSGGLRGIAGKLMSKLGGGGGGGGGEATGWGRKRRMPVQQVMYVSVPVRQAYNGWTEYKQWPQYMHRANQVDADVNEQQARVKVTEKMWGFKRPFTAEVISQRPDEHIKWNATEGTKHTGVVNFHELGPRLTLIELNLDHSPSGPIEKIARGARFVKRAVRADFHRFRGWIEMKSVEELEKLEGWRGTIEDSQIVKSHEDALAEEEREGDEQAHGGEGDEQAQGEYEGEEPEGGEEDESEGAVDEEEEPEAEYEESEEPEDEYEESEDDDSEEPEDEAEEEPEDEAEEEPEDEAEEEPEAAAESDEHADSDEEGERPAQRRQQRRRRSQQDGQAKDRPRRAQPRQRSQPQGDAVDGSDAAARSPRRRRSEAQRSRG